MGTREDLDVQAVIEKEKFVPFLFCRRHLTEVHEERKTADVVAILSSVSRANKTIAKVG